ncbi:hypothetical protein AB8U03_06570 [Clostridium sp. Mt-5]|uniref:Uncharacterized protein n=1 Tax=Clostridium moutaii TaxID=3240932 RepID=A0ABV4BM53_9CLOT
MKYIEVNDINSPKDFSSIWCFNELSARKPAFTLNMYENMGKILEDDIFDSIRQSHTFKVILNKVKNMEENPCDNL